MVAVPVGVHASSRVSRPLFGNRPPFEPSATRASPVREASIKGDPNLMQQTWTWTLVSATLAVAFAIVGLLSTTFYPGATPVLTSALLLASLGSTAAAFTLVARRVRRLELENEGLIEEISQQFDRVKDKLDIFGEALAEPRQVTPEAPAQAPDEPLRRVMVK